MMVWYEGMMKGKVFDAEKMRVVTLRYSHI
jgi:hypothetical protein